MRVARVAVPDFRWSDGTPLLGVARALSWAPYDRTYVVMNAVLSTLMKNKHPFLGHRDPIS